jgi:hypothetical protein
VPWTMDAESKSGCPCPCPLHSKTCSLAAKGGHLDCLKYAHEHGCPWGSDTCSLAAKGGHLDCLKYAHEQGCSWDWSTCHYAAAGGHLDCLKYANEHGCPWDSSACCFAAGGGHLDCLKFAHEHGCPWDMWTCTFAAGGGHLDCLKFAHERGCPWDVTSCASMSLINDDFSCFAYALSHGCDVTGILIQYDGFAWRERLLYVALIIYVGGMQNTDAQGLGQGQGLGPVVTMAEAIIDKVHLIRRMKDAYVNAAATRIQMTWKERMYRPGGAGMLNAGKRFRLSQIVAT